LLFNYYFFNFMPIINLSKEEIPMGEKKVILFNLSGHGHFDMGAYEKFLEGKI